MHAMPDFQRLYDADVSEEFGGGFVNFTHYIRFFPDGTLLCCLKQDFTFPSGRYQDPAYMDTLFNTADPEIFREEEVLSGVWAPLEEGFSFTVYKGSKVEEEGTGSVLPNGRFTLRVNRPDRADTAIREY